MVGMPCATFGSSVPSFCVLLEVPSRMFCTIQGLQVRRLIVEGVVVFVMDVHSAGDRAERICVDYAMEKMCLAAISGTVVNASVALF